MNRALLSPEADDSQLADPPAQAIDQLDILMSDFASHIKRLTALDIGSVTHADVVAELRDNTYPSLLVFAEVLRDFDAELGEMVLPAPSLSPEHALALAAALRCGQTLAAAARSALSEISSDATRDALGAQASEFDAASQLASAVLHGLVVIEDETRPDEGEAP